MASLHVGIIGFNDQDLSFSSRQMLASQQSPIRVSWLPDASMDPATIEMKKPYDIVFLDCRVIGEKTEQLAVIKYLFGDALIIGLVEGENFEQEGPHLADLNVREDMAAAAMGWAIRERWFLKEMQKEREQLKRQLDDASYTIEMADVSSTVLHNVGNVLNSVNVAVRVVHDLVTQSSVMLVHQIAELLKGQQEDLETFLTMDPKGKRIAPALVKLGDQVLSEQKTMLKEIEGLVRNIDHVKQIILSHQTMTKSKNMSESLSVIELIEQALDLSFQPGDVRWINIIRDYQAVPNVFIERHQVLQVLVNLLRNAKQAMQLQRGTDHTLTIRAECPLEGEPSVILTIRDTGVGIAPEHLSRLFNRGFTTKHDGNGIGLHSSMVTVHRMGGSLQVSSDGPGLGATFALSLPVYKKAEPS